MPLNCLFHRHQLSLMLAASAHSDSERSVHLASAADLADRIDDAGRAVGATAAPLVRA